MTSVAARLQSDLDTLTERIADLIRDLPIECLNTHSSSVIIVAPDYYWGNASSEQLNDQLAIKRDYEEWFDIFKSVFAKATEDINRRIDEADSRLRKWIELGSNWSISYDRSANEEKLRADVQLFYELLAILDTTEEAETILIPDTNAIVSEPAPINYKSLASKSTYVFLLLPTVLAELDDLKINHRNPDFRNKVNKVITRIKGWRKQGSLREGVTVDQTITIRAIASEPQMENTLSWLDRSNRDDRIIASVLEVQSNQPNARVVLVTGDINLSNKADVARIETAEL